MCANECVLLPSPLMGVSAMVLLANCFFKVSTSCLSRAFSLFISTEPPPPKTISDTHELPLNDPHYIAVVSMEISHILHANTHTHFQTPPTSTFLCDRRRAVAQFGVVGVGEPQKGEVNCQCRHPGGGHGVRLERSEVKMGPLFAQEHRTNSAVTQSHK